MKLNDALCRALWHWNCENDSLCNVGNKLPTLPDYVYFLLFPGQDFMLSKIFEHSGWLVNCAAFDVSQSARKRPSARA